MPGPKMSTEVRQELNIIPAQLSAVKHVRHVYACRKCQREDIKTLIVTAPMPRPVLPGSSASASSLACITGQKYVEGLPLYRQSQHWASLGVELSRRTLANRVVKGAIQWLVPLYSLVHEHLVAKDILHADESTVQVLREPADLQKALRTCGCFAQASKHPVRFHYVENSLVNKCSLLHR